jgi:4'-phosphopantetheinyl transferase
MGEEYVRAVPQDLSTEIRLWWVDLDAYAATVPLNGLDPDELGRAERMAFTRDAKRFLACRHALRRLLGEALGDSASRMRLVVDGFGKPVLAEGALHFNLSHSGAEALIGLSWGDPVGVDIEVVRAVPDADALAGEHFTPRERAFWVAGPDAARNERFLECWTGKEACMKALGLGLSIQPAAVDLGQVHAVREVDVPVRGGRARVRIRPVRPSAHAVGAVALASPGAVATARRAGRPTGPGQRP